MVRDRVENRTPDTFEQLRAVLVADAPSGWDGLRLEYHRQDSHRDIRTLFHVTPPTEKGPYDPRKDAATARDLAERSDSAARDFCEELAEVERSIARIVQETATSTRQAMNETQNAARETRERLEWESAKALLAADQAEAAAKRAMENSVSETKFENECARVRQFRREAELAYKKVMVEFSDSGWIIDQDGWSSFSGDDFSIAGLCDSLLLKENERGRRPAIGMIVTWNLSGKCDCEFVLAKEKEAAR